MCTGWPRVLVVLGSRQKPCWLTWAVEFEPDRLQGYLQCALRLLHPAFLSSGMVPAKVHPRQGGTRPCPAWLRVVLMHPSHGTGLTGSRDSAF